MRIFKFKFRFNLSVPTTTKTRHLHQNEHKSNIFYIEKVSDTVHTSVCQWEEKWTGDKHEDGHRRSTGKFWKSCVAFGIIKNTFLPAEQNLVGHIRVMLGEVGETSQWGGQGEAAWSSVMCGREGETEGRRDVTPEAQLFPKPKPQWEELE